MDCHVRTREVRYHADAAGLFAALGGADVARSADAVLLESTDITTKHGLQSVAVLRGSARVTCDGRTATVEPLTASGCTFADALCTQLGEYLDEAAIRPGAPAATAAFTFPRSEAADERDRLTAASTVAVLRALTTEAPYQTPQLPFLAGGVAFDYLETFEELPSVAESPNSYPDFQFLLAEVLLVINHQQHTAKLHAITTGDPAQLEEELAALASRIDALIPEALPEGAAGGADPAAPKLDVQVNMSDAQFGTTVEQLKQNIYQGDIYQVVPGRSFTLDCPDAFAAYRVLGRTNPSPYMFYLRGIDRNGESYELFGASPESNLKYDAANRVIRLYPIAGTRPRGLNPDGTVNPELDIRAELDMRTDAKELSEHTMLVDLARNDLARVAVPGTRKVAQLL